MEEKKRLEVVSTQEFTSCNLSGKLNQDTINFFSGIGEIIKGIKQDYSDGNTASYLLIRPNGTYPQDFKDVLCFKLPYNF